LYSSTNRHGLNIRLTKTKDRSGNFSADSIKKMSIAKIGKKRSPEVCKAISERMKEIAKHRSKDYYINFSKANIGRKHTDDHREKNSNSKKGNKFRSNATNRKNLHREL